MLPSTCAEVTPFSNSTAMKLGLLNHICLSLVAIPLTATCMKRSMTGLHHPNYIILLQLYLSAIILHAFSTIVIQSRHLVSFVFFETCNVPVSALTCYIFRHTNYSLVAVMSFTELFLMFERVLAFFSHPNYEKVRRSFGVSFAFLAVVLGFTFNTYLASLSFPLEGYYVFCSTLVIYKSKIFNNIGTFDFFTYTLISIDSISSIILLILYWISKKKPVLPRLDYNLTERFLNRQNKEILAGLAPTMVLHSIFCIGFAVLQNVANRTLSSSGTTADNYLILILSNTVPIYSIVAPLLIMHMDKKSKQQKIRTDKANGDNYFDAYAKIW